MAKWVLYPDGKIIREPDGHESARLPLAVEFNSPEGLARLQAIRSNKGLKPMNRDPEDEYQTIRLNSSGFVRPSGAHTYTPGAALRSTVSGVR